MKQKLLRLWDTFGPAIIVAIIMFLIFKLIILNGFIPSESMEPTLMTGNLVIANRISYKINEPERGDVIVFYSQEYNELLVKRIVGLPGDKIALADGKVYINEKLADESAYVNGDTGILKANGGFFVVPENSVFVMGDNREHSLDSRAWENSYVDYSDIKGKVILEYSIGGDDGFFIKKIDSLKPPFHNLPDRV